MLKWAVNGSRRSYAKITETQDLSGQTQFHSAPSSLNFKSFESPNQCEPDNEPKCNSAPAAPDTNVRTPQTSLYKMKSLKDLSSIDQDISGFQTPKIRKTFKVSRNILDKSETESTADFKMPYNYASTLPSFDVEYSPCVLWPKTLRAPNYVDIPDIYYKQPRYLTSRFIEFTA